MQGKYKILKRELGVERSEADIAGREGADKIEKACLLYCKTLIDRALKNLES